MVRGLLSNHSSDFRQRRSPAEAPARETAVPPPPIYVSAFYVVRGLLLNHSSDFRQRRSPAEAPARETAVPTTYYFVLIIILLLKKALTFASAFYVVHIDYNDLKTSLFISNATSGKKNCKIAERILPRLPLENLYHYWLAIFFWYNITIYTAIEHYHMAILWTIKKYLMKYIKKTWQRYKK